MDDVRGAGGTPGGIGQFVLGVGMAIAGGYLLLNQVTVTSGFWSFWGGQTFGLTLLPLIFGVGLLFFNGSSTPGWVLVFAGTIIIFAGIIANLHIYFRAATLFETLVMLFLLAAGIGLVARALRPHGGG